MDTEGLGGVDENKNHDTRIFTLAVLLSSFFIFNSKGAIDENALQNMSMVVNLANNIQVKEFTDRIVNVSEVNQYFPFMLWVLRDFSLKLEDKDGETISSKD